MNKGNKAMPVLFEKDLNAGCRVRVLHSWNQNLNPDMFLSHCHGKRNQFHHFFFYYFSLFTNLKYQFNNSLIIRSIKHFLFYILLSLGTLEKPGCDLQTRCSRKQRWVTEVVMGRERQKKRRRTDTQTTKSKESDMAYYPGVWGQKQLYCHNDFT